MDTKPRWTHHINLRDILHNEVLTFEQKRDTITSKLRNSG